MPVDWRNYPPDWSNIRLKILRRAKHRCEICGIPDRWYRDTLGLWSEDQKQLRLFTRQHTLLPGTIEPKTHIILTVGHLNHDTTDNRPGNLKALCQRCHLNTRHPGSLYDGRNAGTSVGSATNRAIEHACKNCHQNVHGGNAPSGPYLGR